jgi:hypothetical protein
MPRMRRVIVLHAQCGLANLGQSGVAAVRDKAMLVLSDGREVRLAAL